MSSIIIKYTMDKDTPLAAANFVTLTKDSPTAIAVGETATLNFVADGMYFTLVPVPAKVIVENANRVSWVCKTPFTTAVLDIDQIADPSADVVVTIPVTVKLIPQQITRPFLLQVAAPVDTRLVLTKKEMKEMLDTYQPETYFALCKDDGHFYLYNKNSVPTEETGKYTLITDIVEYSIKSLDGGEILADEGIDG